MNTKTIALVDWYWGGHHANFFVNFAAAIAKAGYRVVPLCSDPDDFTSRLKSLLSEDGNEDLKDSIHDPLFLGQPRRSKIRPARYRAARNAGLRFGAVSKRLREWERIQGAKISCVFFSCIYEQDFECVKKIDKSFGFQWSGLYLHARSFRKPGSKVPYTGMTSCPEKIFSSALVHSVAVLDESAVEPMARITGGKPIICMPDFTEEKLPAPSEGGAGLANKILSFAQGRPVVSLMGHLKSTKGIEEFTAAIQHESLSDVFFFLGGEVTWEGISDAKRRQIQKVWESAGNVFAHLQYISSDTEMNAVMSVSDVIYGAYRDFPHSSNILTKAAIMKKPVIVSDGYVMAERVREYGLGKVVAEGDVDEIAEAIRRMLDDGYADELQSRARWEDYQALHSRDRLPECFERLFSYIAD